MEVFDAFVPLVGLVTLDEALFGLEVILPEPEFVVALDPTPLNAFLQAPGHATNKRARLRQAHSRTHHAGSRNHARFAGRTVSCKQFSG